MKVHSDENYDYYVWSRAGLPTLYNVVPKGAPDPQSGIPNMRYIEKIKNTKFPDRYQPESHGMSPLYPNLPV
jgi:hypothetical protein